MRPIDADALIHHFYETEYASMYYIEVVKRIIDEQPTLSPDDVRGVGEWIEDRMDYRCSACGETVKDEIFYMFYPYRLPKFCPNCGARMKGVSEDA